MRVGCCFAERAEQHERMNNLSKGTGWDVVFKPESRMTVEWTKRGCTGIKPRMKLPLSVGYFISCNSKQTSTALHYKFTVVVLLQLPATQ